jgi:hypothetical protein
VRQRDSGSGTSRSRCRDSRHDLAWNARPQQLRQFLATAPEYERISTLQPDNPAAAPGMHQQKIRDSLLGPCVAAATFAHMNPPAIDPAVGKQRMPGQIVIDHDVCSSKPVAAANRDEFRVARAGANDGYVT